MKKHILSRLKKRWLLIWLIVAVVMSLNSIIAFAVFPSSLPTMNRVAISTSVERGQMFSSNVLIENGTSYYSPQYKTPLTTTQIANNGTYSVDVFLWNYSLKDIYSKYDKPIEYTLSFKLVDSKGEPLTMADLQAAEPETPTANDVRTITVTDQSNNSATFSKNCLDSTELTGDALNILSQTLALNANDISTNSLQLVFSGNWDLVNDTNICLQIIADVDQDEYPDLIDLGAVIGLKKVNDSDISGWYAYLSEHRDTTDTREAASFDGFNLVLEGSGKARITVEIDATKYGINKNFYGTVTVTDTTVTNGVTSTTSRSVHFNEVNYNSTTGTLTIIADSNEDRDSNEESEEYRNRYNIQLYKKGTDDADTATSNWNFFAVKRGTTTAPGTEPTNWSTAGVRVTIVNGATS